MRSTIKPDDQLHDALDRLFPPAAATAVVPIEPGATSPYAGERAAVARAVPSRRDEFFAGRRAARVALAALGVAPSAIGRGPEREPLWPAGVVGSIAHAGGLAAAVVAPATSAWGIGLDVEALAPKPDHAVARLVLREDEGAGIPVRVAFAVKECVFKCLFPATRWRLGFHDVRVEVDLSTGSFRAELDSRFPPARPGLAIFAGGLATTATHIVAGLFVER